MYCEQNNPNMDGLWNSSIFLIEFYQFLAEKKEEGTDGDRKELRCRAGDGIHSH